MKNGILIAVGLGLGLLVSASTQAHIFKIENKTNVAQKFGAQLVGVNEPVYKTNDAVPQNDSREIRFVLFEGDAAMAAKFGFCLERITDENDNTIPVYWTVNEQFNNIMKTLNPVTGLVSLASAPTIQGHDKGNYCGGRTFSIVKNIKTGKLIALTQM